MPKINFRIDDEKHAVWTTFIPSGFREKVLLFMFDEMLERIREDPTGVLAAAWEHNKEQQ